jgi:uncharacterized protein (TIGR02118 family)
MPNMIRVTVSYPATAGARFDLDYYLTKHMPMVLAKLAPYGMKNYSISKGLSGAAPGSPAEIQITALLHIDTLENLQAGMAAESAGIFADIPTYTDIQPKVQIDEVLV